MREASAIKKKTYEAHGCYPALPSKQIDSQDLVKLFHLDVQVHIRFKGSSAKAARRYLYDTLKKYQVMFAGFDGPAQPIEMTFYTGSGDNAWDMILILLRQKENLDDLKLEMSFWSNVYPDHHGKRMYITKENSAQTKLTG